MGLGHRLQRDRPYLTTQTSCLRRVVEIADRWPRIVGPAGREKIRWNLCVLAELLEMDAAFASLDYESGTAEVRKSAIGTALGWIRAVGAFREISPNRLRRALQSACDEPARPKRKRHRRECGADE